MNSPDTTISPIQDNTNILGIITVRRSMRIANKERVIYDSDNNISGKGFKRDIEKMEISPIRQLKKLTIEARHTLSLQESKKKRQKFEKSLFLPNNKKRKDVLKIFNKKSVPLLKPIIKENPNLFFVSSNPLNKQCGPTKNSYESDSSSSDSSKQSHKSFPKKRNSFVSKGECNDDFVESDEEEITSSKETTDEQIIYPSYVAFRTKGNKLKLVQNQDAPATASKSKPQGLLDSTTFNHKSTEFHSVTEKTISATESYVCENPSVNYSPAMLMPQTKSIYSPSVIIDLTQKSQPITRPTVSIKLASNHSGQSIYSANDIIDLTQKPQYQKPLAITTEYHLNSTPNIIIDLTQKPEFIERPNVSTESISNFAQFNKPPMSAINSSPCLPSNSSTNSMEFLMQSPASDASTAFLSDFSETPNVEPPKEYSPKKISDYSRIDRTIEYRKPYMLKARSTQPLEFIVSNEQLPTSFPTNACQLIQDAEVQSSTNLINLECSNEGVEKLCPAENAVSISSIEEATQHIEYNCTQPKNNQEIAIANGEAVNQQSSHKIPDARISNFKRYFEAVSRRRQSFDGESAALTSLDTEQQRMQGGLAERPATLPETLKTQTNLHGQIRPSNSYCVELENQTIPNFEFNSQCNNSNKQFNTQQTETLPRSNNDNLNLQDTPNCRYFRPFYLQRISAEQEQTTHVVANERHVREPIKASTNTQEITNKSTHLYQRETAMAASGKKLQYSYANAFNNQIGASHQTVSYSPAHYSEQNNLVPSKTNQPTPMEITQPESVSSRPTAPPFKSHPYYSPPGPVAISGFSPHQHRFASFPAVQQEIMHSNTSANSFNLNSPISHSSITNSSFNGYSNTNEAFTRLENPNQPSANLSGARTSFTQVPYDSHNLQHYINNQRPGIEPPSYRQPFTTQPSVDPNKWLNDRFQQTIIPNNNNKKSTWLSRPQEPLGSMSSRSPVDRDAWVRARTRDAAAAATKTTTKPSKSRKLTNEQRISQLEVVVKSFKEFVTNFQSFNNSLVGSSATATAAPSTPPVAMQTSPPWLTMRNNSRIIGNTATQPIPEPHFPWGEYNNPMSRMQMNANPVSSRNNAAWENFMRTKGNSVNHYPIPIPQHMHSHQIYAADSTTGGSSNSCSNLRSFRPTQH